MSPRPSVKLHIEELVLHGFSPHDRHNIGEAVERELQRLLFASPILAGTVQDQNIERMDGGSFRLSSSAPAGTVGAQIASVVHSTVRGLSSSSSGTD